VTQHPHPPTQPYGSAPGQAGDARTASVLAHLSAPIAALVSAGWLSLLGPLVVYVLYKDRDPVVRQASAGAFNFNLSFWVVNLVSWLLIITVVGALVGIPLLVISFLVAAWCHVHGAIRASNGQPYSYPFQIPVLH
jgi:uncharacterized protein